MKVKYLTPKERNAQRMRVLKSLAICGLLIALMLSHYYVFEAGLNKGLNEGYKLKEMELLFNVKPMP